MIGITYIGENQEYAVLHRGVSFTPGWDKAIIAAIKAFNLDGASPLCPRFHGPESSLGANKYNPLFITNKIVEGYVVDRHIASWCIVVKKELAQLAGNIEDYAATVKAGNIKHAVVCNSIVHSYVFA